MSGASGPALWDAEAPGFDAAPDHGLLDPDVRAAWRDLLLGVLPSAPADVVDLGCGTGTLAVLLAEHGYAVDAVDFSPAMVRLASAKVAAASAPVRRLVTVRTGDAADPGLAPASVDVVLCRHVLWALPDPALAVRRWVACAAARRPAGAGRGRLVDRCRARPRSAAPRSWGSRARRSRCATCPTRGSGVGRSPTSATSCSRT